VNNSCVNPLVYVTRRAVGTMQLMAFTGTHFVNASALRLKTTGQTEAAAAMKSAICVAQPTDAPAASKRGRVTRSVASEAPECNAAALVLYAANGADAGNRTSACPSQPALDHLLDVIEAEAPAELTSQEILAFVRAASYFNADVILANVPAYLAPMLLSAPYMEVCHAACSSR
jgi:hypothetical protein